MYTIEKATLISEQLSKFTTAYTYQVAGHFSNIDFWMAEVVAALKALDEHKDRFEKLYQTQKKWIEDHGTIVHEYCAICGGRCEFSNGVPSLPQMKFKEEKKDTRKELVDAAYYFLLRCYRIGLLDIASLKAQCEFIGTSVDLDDLKKQE